MMLYLPLTLEENPEHDKEVHRRNLRAAEMLAWRNIVLIRETSPLASTSIEYGLGTARFGHVLIVKDPSSRPSKSRTRVEPMYADSTGTSHRYVDTVDEAVQTAAMLRSLIAMMDDFQMNIVVIGYDLFDEIRNLGYANDTNTDFGVGTAVRQLIQKLQRSAT